MGWEKDGAGRWVKRIRGFTMPQWVTNVRIRQEPQFARWTRGQKGNGRLCNPDTAAKERRNEAARRRDRRANRREA
jgi:hypothetical protein